MSLFGNLTIWVANSRAGIGRAGGRSGWRSGRRVLERALDDMTLPQFRVLALIASSPERANRLAETSSRVAGRR